MPNTSRIQYMAPHGYIRSFRMVVYFLYLSLVRHPDRNLNYNIRSIGATIVAGPRVALRRSRFAASVSAGSLYYALPPA
jgi:hypothetical protein